MSIKCIAFEKLLAIANFVEKLAHLGANKNYQKTLF